MTQLLYAPPYKICVKHQAECRCTLLQQPLSLLVDALAAAVHLATRVLQQV
jgi:hypothetical protein